MGLSENTQRDLAKILQDFLNAHPVQLAKLQESDSELGDYMEEHSEVIEECYEWAMKTGRCQAFTEEQDVEMIAFDLEKGRGGDQRKSD